MSITITDFPTLQSTLQNTGNYPSDGLVYIGSNITFTSTITTPTNAPAVTIESTPGSGPYTLSYPSSSNSTNYNFVFRGAGVTLDNIIIDGGTNATSNVGNPPNNVSVGGGGISIQNGVNTIGAGCTIQNCYTNGNLQGGTGAVNVWSNSGPITLNLYGTIQYNRGTGNNFQATGAGMAIIQQSSNNSILTNMYPGAKIVYNSAFCAGGGLFVDTWALNMNTNNVFNMTGGNIDNNYTQTVGGGIAAGASSDDNVTLNISGGSISNNKADNTGTSYNTVNGVQERGNGGGIWIQDGTTTISGNTQIWNNVAVQYGGGAYTSSSISPTDPKAPTINVQGGDWKANTAVQGAAIYKNGGPLTVNGGIFHDHVSTGDGAVFYANNANTSLIASALPSNLTPDDTATPTAGTISVFGNTANGGNGGVVANKGNPASTFTATNVLFYKNTATGNGGVLYSDTANINQFNGCILDSNSAQLGGAYYITQ